MKNLFENFGSKKFNTKNLKLMLKRAYEKYQSANSSFWVTSLSFYTILAILALLSVTCRATEILSEYYVMEKVLPLLTEAQSYTINGQEVKAIKVDNKVLKALSTTDDPFYYYNSAKEKKMVRLGDYILTPMTFSSIDSASSSYFNNNFIKK